VSGAAYIERQVRSLRASASAAQTAHDAAAFRRLARHFEAQLGRQASA
jgi:hypothetical protein